MTKAVTEQELSERTSAPRVTEKDLKDNIEHVTYFTAAEGSLGARPAVSAYSPLNTLTFCVIVLKNGFTVTGESACASPENYRKDIGERIAFENAVGKIWPLMGYALRERLAATRSGQTWLDGDARRNGEG